jgi:hypothetical protein
MNAAGWYTRPQVSRALGLSRAWTLEEEYAAVRTLDVPSSKSGRAMKYYFLDDVRRLVVKASKTKASGSPALDGARVFALRIRKLEARVLELETRLSVVTNPRLTPPFEGRVDDAQA